MSSYLDKTGLERVWSKATDKFATIATTDELKGNIETLTSTKADKTEVETAVAGLVDSAPETLNTLNELAAALGDDPNFATTIATEVGKKVNSSEYNDAIAGINANIASITPEKIGALNKEEYLGPVVLEGNPIVYESGTEGLGIAAVSYLEPKQSGSGDPYPAGGGKNLLVDVTVFDTVWLKGVISLTAGITYTLSVQETADALYFSNEGGTVDYATAYNAKHLTYTPETSGIHVLFARYANGADLAYNMMLEKGSAATEYAPPSNIRPIIGYDKLNLNRAGKNLIPYYSFESGYIQNGTTVTINTDKSITLSGTPTADTWFYISTYSASHDTGFKMPAGNYLLSGCPSGGGSDKYTLGISVYRDGVYVDGATNSDQGTGGYANLIDGDRIEMYIRVRSGQTIDGLTFYPMLRLASIADDTYEPYQGKLHTVQIGQTVYGFRYDWLTGKGLIEWKAMRLLSSYVSSSMKYVPGHVGVWMDKVLAKDVSEGKETILCSHLVGRQVYDWARDGVYVEGGNTIGIQFNGASIPNYTDTGNADQNADLVKAYLDSNEVWIAWKLAAPIEIQLTPTQISELEGINTLYGDGSNIRAIFNTTGGASPVLESISGILPVEKGGTGSTSAAGARNNLGITPQNIGALGNSGRQKIADGTFIVGNRNGNASNLDLYTDDTNTTLRFLKDGENNTNNLSLYEEYTILGKPLTVSSGGTGATTAAQARTNLGITPANIGAAPTSHASTATTYGVGSTTNYGHLKVGSNISVSSGTISLTKANVTSALGYTPPTADTNTTYTFATGDSNGQIKVTPSGGSAQNISVKGLGSAAYKDASGSWGISVTGNAATASAFSSARSIELSGAVYGTVSSNGASGWSINTTIAEKAITPTNFTSTFRTQTKGDTANSAYLSVIRNDAEDSWGCMPRYGTGIAFGRGDTHAYLYTSYNTLEAYIGGGSSNNLHWVRRLAFTDGTGASGTWGINITGNAATATSLSGTLAVNKGGTGITSNPSMLVNLGSTSAANVFAASPRPGITGTLGVGNGGTGATTAADARSKLGITPANIGALSSQGGTLTGSTLIKGGSDWVGYRISRTANNIACNSDYAISGTGCAEMTLKQAGSTVNYVSLQPNATVLGKPLAIGSGGTGAVSKSGARTNLGITSGTSLPSSASAGDIFFLYS